MSKDKALESLNNIILKTMGKGILQNIKDKVYGNQLEEDYHNIVNSLQSEVKEVTPTKSAKEMFKALGYIESEPSWNDFSMKKVYAKGLTSFIVFTKDKEYRHHFRYNLSTTRYYAGNISKELHLAIRQQMIELGWCNDE